jgi:hypothetical protein
VTKHISVETESVSVEMFSISAEILLTRGYENFAVQAKGEKTEPDAA